MTTKTYHVPDISCKHCVATIERELKDLVGVNSVKAEESSKNVTVDAVDEKTLTNVELTLAEIGYPAE
jgi:copper chaperone CopZ